MTAADKNRALDRNETEWVEMSRSASHLTDAQLTDLLRRLRERRDRAQRLIRTRTRQATREGQTNVDAGAREKKAQLAEAIERAAKEQKRRRASTSATRNLKAAVARKAEQTHDGIPENRTANTGPADTPNNKIAPSGALHAEGMRGGYHALDWRPLSLRAHPVTPKDLAPFFRRQDYGKAAEPV